MMIRLGGITITPRPLSPGLCEPEFVAHEDSWEGVLKHGSYHEAKQLGVDESVMWGEYFFVETSPEWCRHHDCHNQPTHRSATGSPALR